MTDDISKAFDKLKIKHFFQEPSHFFEHETGSEQFDDFIHRQFYGIRYAFAASDGGTVNPISALSDGRHERLFDSLDDENTQQMFDRIGAVAKATGSTRYFYGRMTTIRVGSEDVRAVLWFAEDSANKIVRSGYIPITDPDGRLGAPIESVGGYSDWAGEQMKSILHR